MSFPRYERYTRTPVQWLSSIPAHWTIVKARYVGKAQIGLTYDPKDITDSAEGTLVLRASNIKDGRIDLEDAVYVRGAIPVDLQTRLGDILLCSRSGSRALIGKNALIQTETAGFAFGAFMTVFRSPLNSYLYWVFNSSIFEAQSASFLTSTINQLTVGDLNGFHVPVPPASEQVAIVTVLTAETQRIDALIREQERLIVLLQEKREALISHAVTKGLNPDAPMKPSGIEWLGDVPEHWKCYRNKIVFAEVDERNASNDGELLTVSHITGVTPRSQKSVNMFLAETLEGYKKCRTGDLVINTMWAWMGALGCSPCDGVVSPSYNVYRKREVEICPAFYDYLCRIPPHRIAIKAQSSGIWESRLRLYPDAFLDMRVALPPINEQVTIAHYLDAETKAVDNLISQAGRAIELLDERRTTLISAAVTGQIDVRQSSELQPA